MRMRGAVLALAVANAWGMDEDASVRGDAAHASGSDTAFTALLQVCAHGAPQAAAIAIADGHPTPDQAMRLDRTLLARGSTAAALIALAGLAQLGPAARAAAPEVLALLARSPEPAVRGAGVQTLLALQPTAPDVPIVSACLQDARLPPQARADAARLVGGWGAVGLTTRPLLAELVANEDGDLAGAAYAALVELAPCATTSTAEAAPGGPATDLVPGAGLDRQVHAFAALPSGPYPEVMCARLLILAQEDPRRGARMMAWIALARAGMHQPTVVAAFLQHLVMPDPDLQQQCAWALLGDVGDVGDMGDRYPGPGAEPNVIQILGEALGGSPEQVRCALGALRRLGPAGTVAGPQVWALLDRHDLSLEQIAGCLGVLRSWGPLARADQERIARLLDPVQPIYAGRTHDQADAIQAMGLSTLASCGVPPSARRWILAALASPDPVTPAAFAAAARAVISEGPSGGYAVTSLLPVLDAGFSDAALDVDNLPSLMRRSHPVAGEVRTIPAGSPSARWYAIRALGAIGPAAAAAVPRLRAISQQGLAGAGNSAALQVAAGAALCAIQGP